MRKIKITSEQYTNLLLREQRNRLSSKLLNESNKEVLLAVSSLMGVNLSGLNKEIAEKALKDKTIMNKVVSTLENDEKINELVSNLEEKGMKNAKDKLSVNSKKIVDNFNENSDKNNLGLKMGSFIIYNLNDKE